MGLTASGSQSSGRRVALVIGNGAYRLGPALANPRTDAVAISEALSRLGFDPVQQYLDLDKPGHDRALKQFAAVSKNAEMALIYYAGHGMELDGENYLLPVDAELEDVRSLAFEATRLSDIMRGVEGAERLRFVILDACRDNPFRRQMQGIEATRSMVSRGLSAPPDLSGNTLVAYAARPGTQAKDGKKGSNSPFAAAILKHIETPNTDIRLVIGRIRDEVWETTQKQQEPAFYGSMGGAEVQLKYVASAPPPADTVLDAGTLVKALEEERDWEKAQRANTTDAYGVFLASWASGRFAEQASSKVEEIKETADFAKAKAGSDTETLRSFLGTWPRGKLTEQAQELLEKRGGDAAWDSTVRAMTQMSSSDDKFSADALRNFVVQYPRSTHVADIKKKLAAAEKEQEAAIAATQSRAAWERYLRNWPEGSKRAEAQRLLDGGGDDRLWIEVQKDKSSAIVGRYLADWPAGRHAEEARKLLKKRQTGEKRFERFAMVFTLAILGCMVLGIIGFLYAAVPYVWNNGWSILDMVREKAVEIIQPRKKTEVLNDPTFWPRSSTLNNPFARADEPSFGKSLSTFDKVNVPAGSAAAREVHRLPEKIPLPTSIGKPIDPGAGTGSGTGAFTFPSSNTAPSLGGTGGGTSSNTSTGAFTWPPANITPSLGVTHIVPGTGTFAFPASKTPLAAGDIAQPVKDPFQFNGDKHQPATPSPPAK